MKPYCWRVRNFLNFIIFSNALLQFTCKSHDRKLCLIRKNQIKYGEQGRSSKVMLCNYLQNSNIFLKNCRNPQGSEFNFKNISEDSVCLTFQNFSLQQSQAIAAQTSIRNFQDVILQKLSPKTVLSKVYFLNRFYLLHLSIV